MAESILNGKLILAVDDEPDVLMVLEEEVLEAAPRCQFDKATTYQEAVEKMASWTYDIVVLDIMGVRGFDLLKLAVNRNFPVAMLTAHSLSPESLKRSIEMGARAYLPKDKLGEIVPFLDIHNFRRVRFLTRTFHRFLQLRQPSQHRRFFILTPAAAARALSSDGPIDAQ
jgi:CheY-like chemotaxis protein